MCENCHLEECCDFCDTRKNIPFRDKGNRQEYRILNQNENIICKIRVDDCLIIDGNKCDYLAIECYKKENQTIINSLYFIELKGSDLIHALNQIEATIKHQKIKKFINQDYNIYARVVLNKQRTPDIRSSQKIKFEKMIKKLGGDLKTQGKKMEEIF